MILENFKRLWPGLTGFNHGWTRMDTDFKKKHQVPSAKLQILKMRDD
jgi:hypothetical protein